MQPISRNWLIAIAMLGSGILAQAILPEHQTPLLHTTLLRTFPYQLAGLSGTDVQDSEARETRDSYQPAAIVYRNYSDGKQPPVEIFIAPVPVGVHSPSYCLRYNGWMLTQRSQAPLPGAANLELSQIVSTAPSGETEACAYYWRVEDGGIHDNAIRLWFRQKLALLRGRGQDSFLVDLCLPIKDQPSSAAAFSRLSQLAAEVDPVVARLLRQATQVK